MQTVTIPGRTDGTDETDTSLLTIRDVERLDAVRGLGELMIARSGRPSRERREPGMPGAERGPAAVLPRATRPRPRLPYDSSAVRRIRAFSGSATNCS